jgi:hypothetical protein
LQPSCLIILYSTERNHPPTVKETRVIEGEREREREREKERERKREREREAEI